MKYVAVKHQPDNEISYWFEVPEDLEGIVKVGKEVLCNTKRGDMPGYIVSIMDGVPQTEAMKIIGSRFPLKKLIGVATDMKLSDIYIPWKMSTSSPEPKLIAKRIDEFYAIGGFKTPVLFASNGNLKDGYSAYLVAKMFGHETLRGLCVTTMR